MMEISTSSSLAAMPRRGGRTLSSWGGGTWGRLSPQAPPPQEERVLPPYGASLEVTTASKSPSSSRTPQS